MGSLGGYLDGNMMFLMKKPRGLLPRLARWWRYVMMSENSVPLHPMINDHYPVFKWLAIIGGIPHFQTHPCDDSDVWSLQLCCSTSLITAALWSWSSVAKTWMFLWQWVKPCQTPQADEVNDFFLLVYRKTGYSKHLKTSQNISKHLETSQNCWTIKATALDVCFFECFIRIDEVYGIHGDTFGYHMFFPCFS